MANCRVPNVLVYVREKGGKRSFCPAPSNPDLTACYWLRYEKNRKQAWQRVGQVHIWNKARGGSVMTVYREGSTVPQSGIYDVLHHGQCKPRHQVTCIKGKKFPPCRKCGHDVKFRLYKAAIHIGDDPLLEIEAWKSAAVEALSKPLPKG